MKRRFYPRSRSNFRYRSKPRVHLPKKSGLYQRANVFLTPVQFVATPAADELLVLHLASLTDFFDDRAIASSERFKYLDIGGIVMHWDFVFGQTRSTTAFFDFDLTSYWQMLLVSDRLDDLGNPVALTSNWATNTVPVVVAAATETQDEDTRFPTRVHHRDFAVANFNEVQNSSIVLANEQAQRMVLRSSGSKNLRLRLRLDDEHGLFLHFHGATNNQFPSEGFVHQCTLAFSASLFYRYSL